MTCLTVRLQAGFGRSNDPRQRVHKPTFPVGFPVGFPDVHCELCKNFVKDSNNIATKFSTESQSDNEVNYNSGADADIFTITKVSPVKRSKTR